MRKTWQIFTARSPTNTANVLLKTGRPCPLATHILGALRIQVLSSGLIFRLSGPQVPTWRFSSLAGPGFVQVGPPVRANLHIGGTLPDFASHLYAIFHQFLNRKNILAAWASLTTPANTASGNALGIPSPQTGAHRSRMLAHLTWFQSRGGNSTFYRLDGAAMWTFDRLEVFSLVNSILT